MEGSPIDKSVNWYEIGEWLDEPTNKAEYHMGLNTELMSSSMHIGTHIDALSHFTTENDNHWYNGFSGDRYSTNFGPAMRYCPDPAHGDARSAFGYSRL